MHYLRPGDLRRRQASEHASPRRCSDRGQGRRSWATAELLARRASEVLEANAADLADVSGPPGLARHCAMRLALNEEGQVAKMAEGVRAIAALDDPVG